MRKTSLVLLGAVAGAAVTLIAVQPSSRLLIGSSAWAAQADTYRQLNLFGDIFERVRSHYVEKPDDGKLVEAAVNGMLNGLDPHDGAGTPARHQDQSGLPAEPEVGKPAELIRDQQNRSTGGLVPPVFFFGFG